MPFYRYVCQSCGEEYRVLHASDSTEPVTCPSCGSQDAERQLPRVAVQFKGSGYYKTDRDPKRSKAGTKSLSKSSTSSDTSSKKDGAGKPESGTEKKAAASKPAKSSGDD